MKTVNKNPLPQFCTNYQQLSSRACWKRFSIIAGSTESRPTAERSSRSDNFHGKRISKARVDLAADDDDGDWFFVLWLIRGCESMSIAADGAIGGSEDLIIDELVTSLFFFFFWVKDLWLVSIWILESACMRQYIDVYK